MAYSKNRRLAEIVSDVNGNVSVEGLIVPTQSASDNDTSAASTAFVHTHIDAVLDAAPGTLNTLNEIAAALNDDANFNATVTNAIAAKLPLAGGTMTGNIAHASDFTLDVGGDLNLDADGGDVNLKDGGTAMGRLGFENGDLNIASAQQDYDIRLKGNDGGSVITALHLDMSQAGYATFNSGVSLGGETKLGDNSKLILGAGDDLQIYHNGSNASIILDNNSSSDLLIQSNNIVLEKPDGTNMIHCAGGGAVQLYHNGSSKLATTSTGATVTGDIKSSTKLITKTTSGEVIRFERASDALRFSSIHANSTDGGGAFIQFKVHTGASATSTADVMTLKGNGDVLIGKTNNAFSVAGIGLRGDVADFIRSGNTAINVNRLASDGSTMKFHQAGTLVGQVNTLSGRMGIGSGDTGLFFDSTRDCISPFTMTGNDGRASAIDIGRSGVKFKDLHLSGYTYSAGFTTHTSMAGIGVSQGDVNAGELGPGYITLSRDDNADADQILLMKNGNLHTKMITVANGFKIHHQGSDIHLMTNEGGTARRINFSGSIPSFKPFDSNTGQIDLGTASARWKEIHLSGGVNFSGNANAANMTSELLDDYEEGTWTPALKNTGGTSATHTSQIGKYTKVGDMVHVHGTITCSAGADLSGTVAIFGLPFAANSGGGFRNVGQLGALQGCGANAERHRLVLDPNNSYIYLITQNGQAYSHNPGFNAAINMYGFSLMYSAA